MIALDLVGTEMLRKFGEKALHGDPLEGIDLCGEEASRRNATRSAHDARLPCLKARSGRNTWERTSATPRNLPWCSLTRTDKLQADNGGQKRASRTSALVIDGFKMKSHKSMRWPRSGLNFAGSPASVKQMRAWNSMKILTVCAVGGAMVPKESSHMITPLSSNTSASA